MVVARCLDVFLQSIGSEKTKDIYRYHLDNFLKWNKGCKDYDDLLKADEKSIQRNLEDYVIFLKDSGKSPNYLPSILAPVELFYVMNDVTINTKRLHKFFPTKTKRGGYGNYTIDDIALMLDTTTKKRTRALILFFASTGCRAGSIEELKLGHITNREDCKEVLVYADSKEEYTTFMTPEASRAFDDYLEERQQDHEKLTPLSPAFRKSYRLGSVPAISMDTPTVKSAILMSLKHVKKIKKGNRFNKPTVHAFRKFFNVSLKERYDCNLSLCEKLMGHSVTIPLDNNYGTFLTDKLFEEYKKAIPALSISKQYQLQEQIKKNEEESKSSKDKLTEELHSLKRDNLDMKEDNLDMKVRFVQLKEAIDELTKRKET
jgi:integrase